MAHFDLIGTEQVSSPDAADRLGKMLVRYLGPMFLSTLGDDDVTEVYVNPDAKVWKETFSMGPVYAGYELEPTRTLMFLNAVATHQRVTLDRANPALAANLPLDFFNKARLQGRFRR